MTPGRLTAVALMIGLLAVSGCAQLGFLAPPQKPVEAIKAAEKKQDFQRAMSIVERIKPGDPHYKQVQAELTGLRTRIRDFELKSIHQAEQLADQDQWQKAFDTLDHAMVLWRPSDPLVQERQKLKQREEEQRREIHGDLLLSEAHWRLAQEPTLKRLRAIPDHASEQVRDEWQSDNTRLAHELVEQGRFFAGQNDWLRVRDYLVAAQKLDKGAGNGKLLARARKQLASEEKAARAARQRKLVSQGKTLLDQYQQSGKLEDLLQLRDFVARHDDEAALDGLRKHTNELCQSRYHKDLDRGSVLYAQGEYRQAYKVWQRIVPLAPADGELEKKLQRVRHVLKTLKDLKDG